MKPDRKQPARAPASPSTAATRTAAGQPHNQPQNQSQKRLQDWYVIADEGDLTLRISSGLRVGEDRWGELTLNHPLSAHRWLEFTIDGNGELWCRSSRKDIVVRCNGEVLEEVMLDAGVPIALPHNLLHISNHINRGQSKDWRLEIGLLEPSAAASGQQFDKLVDTHTQLPKAPVAEEQTSSPNTIKDTIKDTTGLTKAEAAATSAKPLAAPIETPIAEPSTAQPAATGGHAPAQAETVGIPTLETVVVKSRPLTSSDAGPAIERAVAKLKSRTGSFPIYRESRAERSATAESVESALVPVDANGPFHTDEIRAAIQQPITVGETTAPAAGQPGNQQRPFAAGRAPIYTPAVTTGVTQTANTPASQRNLVLGLALVLLLVTGAALLVAIIAAPSDHQSRSLANVQRSANPEPAQPTVNTPAPEPQKALVTPATSVARTKSLLQTANALLTEPASLDNDTLSFAIRSLNLVLAAEPNNTQATALLSQATAIQQQRETGAGDFLTSPAAGTTSPQDSAINAAERVNQAIGPATSLTGKTPDVATPEPGISDYGNTTTTEPWIADGGAAPADWRLLEANRLLAAGNILRPRDASAVNLILNVLAEDPKDRNAIRLLNRSADLLIAQADEEYRTIGEYAARNTLEEVLSFHPRHPGANDRWQAWVGER